MMKSLAQSLNKFGNGWFGPICVVLVFLKMLLVIFTMPMHVYFLCHRMSKLSQSQKITAMEESRIFNGTMGVHDIVQS